MPPKRKSVAPAEPSPSPKKRGASPAATRSKRKSIASDQESTTSSKKSTATKKRVSKKAAAAAAAEEDVEQVAAAAEEVEDAEKVDETPATTPAKKAKGGRSTKKAAATEASVVDPPAPDLTVTGNAIPSPVPARSKTPTKKRVTAKSAATTPVAVAASAATSPVTQASSTPAPVRRKHRRTRGIATPETASAATPKTTPATAKSAAKSAAKSSTKSAAKAAAPSLPAHKVLLSSNKEVEAVEATDSEEICGIWEQTWSALHICLSTVGPLFLLMIIGCYAHGKLNNNQATASIALVYSYLMLVIMGSYAIVIVPFILMSRILTTLVAPTSNNQSAEQMNFYCRMLLLIVAGAALVLYQVPHARTLVGLPA